MINGSIMNGGQINGITIQNTSNLCKVKVDDVGFHIINNVGGGTQNIEKIKLTTVEYDGNGIVEFTNNNNQSAEISFTDNDLVIRSDNGISITGEATFNSSLKANTIKGNVIESDSGDIIIESGYGGKINLNVMSGRNIEIGNNSSDIGFFGASPVQQQTAALLSGSANSTYTSNEQTLINNLNIKVNGLINKLAALGLFKVS